VIDNSQRHHSTQHNNKNHDTQHKDTRNNGTRYRYAECHKQDLSVVKLRVVMLNVVAPSQQFALIVLYLVTIVCKHYTLTKICQNICHCNSIQYSQLLIFYMLPLGAGKALSGLVSGALRNSA
jgi:hypothetical protein